MQNELPAPARPELENLKGVRKAVPPPARQDFWPGESLKDPLGRIKQYSIIESQIP
jgi:hypothetical protein